MVSIGVFMDAVLYNALAHIANTPGLGPQRVRSCEYVVLNDNPHQATNNKATVRQSVGQSVCPTVSQSVTPTVRQVSQSVPESVSQSVPQSVSQSVSQSQS